MKYYCKAKRKLTKSREETIKTMYPRIKMVESLDEILEILSMDDTLIFEDILALNSSEPNDIGGIVKTYMDLNDKGVELMFMRSSTCDSEIIYQTFLDFKQKGVSFQSEKSAIKVLLELQIKSYINYKDSNANLKKYAQLSASKNEGKNYGRPVGSKKESSKATKAKELIKANCIDFGGDKTDEECMELTGLARTTFYRYKKQLKEEGYENI